jgi:hypothetical protein
MATGEVTAVDLETLTVSGTVQTGRAPDGLAWGGQARGAFDNTRPARINLT